jgi:hypothetical protein
MPRPQPRGPQLSREASLGMFGPNRRRSREPVEFELPPEFILNYNNNNTTTRTTTQGQRRSRREPVHHVMYLI